jgi:hypothetical protein
MKSFWFPAVYKEEDGFFGVLLLLAVPTEREAEREKRELFQISALH